MVSDLSGSCLLLALPDDVFAVISRSLSPTDVCSLGLSCRDLRVVMASDKVWYSQCDELGVVPSKTLCEWREGVSSYRALCRFFVKIQPLLGIWVHQNPELGNVVYVMPGFLSVVGCRIIPQEVGPLGLEDGPLLWAPVFEFLCNEDGCTAFFLHGRERGTDYVYPGLLKSVDRMCNVLLLEVDPRQENKSYAYGMEKEASRRISRSNSGISKSQRIAEMKGTVVPFSRLGFVDRRRLLDVITNQIRLNVPDGSNCPIFPRWNIDEAEIQRDLEVLHDRRLLLLQMFTFGGGNHDLKSDTEFSLNPSNSLTSEVIKSLESTSCLHTSADGSQPLPKGKTLSGLLKNGLKQILGKSNSSGYNKYQKPLSSSESKHVQLHLFLQSSDTICLSLRAATLKLSSYRSWPNMHDSRFALYKLPVRTPTAGHEFSGLWGGTFGWPPGKPSEDKPGKALFFILISYEESDGQQFLIATKILEGTSYVLHPNGSAMFIVNIGQPSTDAFPWVTDGDSNPVLIKQSFAGEGIANGYGFRYPGSKPGSLFVIQNGLLGFVWKESRAMLTLQRLNLPDLLRKGEKVPSLSPVSNFAYLTKTYSNVFSGFSNSSNGLSLPRQNY